MLTSRIRVAFAEAWPWLALAAVGMVANFVVAALFGASPLDVLLLRFEPAIYQVVDYGVAVFAVARFVECFADASP